MGSIGLRRAGRSEEYGRASAEPRERKIPEILPNMFPGPSLVLFCEVAGYFINVLIVSHGRAQYLQSAGYISCNQPTAGVTIHPNENE